MSACSAQYFPGASLVLHSGLIQSWALSLRKIPAKQTYLSAEDTSEGWDDLQPSNWLQVPLSESECESRSEALPHWTNLPIPDLCRCSLLCPYVSEKDLMGQCCSTVHQKNTLGFVRERTQVEMPFAFCDLYWFADVLLCHNWRLKWQSRKNQSHPCVSISVQCSNTTTRYPDIHKQWTEIF